MTTEVPALHSRRPAYRGRAARTGAVLSELPFTPAFEAYVDEDHRRGSRRCRRASQWWKVPHFIAYLRSHPAVGDAIVDLLLPVLRGDLAWEVAARRAGLADEDELHALHRKTAVIIHEEEWDRWRARARSENCAPNSDCA
jgi:hypothetical protein